ncbi:protein of unknown function (DUF4259) [Micromonospora viridifaciens]|uniref:DUF4259 domain-containing protein n=1 Tax=Micromonospora viridifaciens TaxID=1881 RepID=A0A1C4V6V5_MICVI|nr:protein of unknown function (DUF4259) [Micromonospora viridifaciens]
MGTWGDGPFDNDQAMDIIGELAEMEESERREHLQKLFATVLDPSSAPADAEIPFWPKEVIAAASLIALVLPGGSVVFDPENSDDYGPEAEENADDEWLDALLPEPGGELIRLASEALQVVADPDSKWFTDWVCGDDEEAEWLASIVRILSDSARLQH